MRIAYRKAIWGKDHQAWDTLVNWGSGCGGYAHTELLLDSLGLALSSTTDCGIRLIPIGQLELSTHPEWYDVETIDASAEEERQILIWAQKEIAWKEANLWTDEDRKKGTGKGYDYWGVARFVIWFLKQHPELWFCSEVVTQALIEIGFYFPLPSWRISPNKLHELPKVRNVLN